MMRKYLFWGLTLVLVVALVNLIIRSRRLEQQQSSQVVEVVRQSKPTATRVLAPQDLVIVQSKTTLERKAGGKAQIARHEIEIHNNGSVPYGGIQLSIDYLDRGGKVLASRTNPIASTVLPGATVKLGDITTDDLPASTASAKVAIVYADIEHAPAPGNSKG